MNFEHFVNTDGTRVCVNPELVAALESTVFEHAEGTRITTIGGAVFIVSGSVETVAGRIKKTSEAGRSKTGKRSRKARPLERIMPSSVESTAVDLSPLDA